MENRQIDTTVTGLLISDNGMDPQKPSPQPVENTEPTDSDDKQRQTNKNLENVSSGDELSHDKAEPSTGESLPKDKLKLKKPVKKANDSPEPCQHSDREGVNIPNEIVESAAEIIDDEEEGEQEQEQEHDKPVIKANDSLEPCQHSDHEGVNIPDENVDSAAERADSSAEMAVEDEEDEEEENKPVIAANDSTGPCQHSDNEGVYIPKENVESAAEISDEDGEDENGITGWAGELAQDVLQHSIHQTPQRESIGGITHPQPSPCSSSIPKRRQTSPSSFTPPPNTSPRPNQNRPTLMRSLSLPNDSQQSTRNKPEENVAAESDFDDSDSDSEFDAEYKAGSVERLRTISKVRNFRQKWRETREKSCSTPVLQRKGGNKGKHVKRRIPRPRFMVMLDRIMDQCSSSGTDDDSSSDDDHDASNVSATSVCDKYLFHNRFKPARPKVKLKAKSLDTLDELTRHPVPTTVREENEHSSYQVQAENSQVQSEHSQVQNEHSPVQTEHSPVQTEHSQVAAFPDKKAKSSASKEKNEKKKIRRQRRRRTAPRDDRLTTTETSLHSQDEYDEPAKVGLPFVQHNENVGLPMQDQNHENVGLPSDQNHENVGLLMQDQNHEKVGLPMQDQNHEKVGLPCDQNHEKVDLPCDQNHEKVTLPCDQNHENVGLPMQDQKHEKVGLPMQDQNHLATSFPPDPGEDHATVILEDLLGNAKTTITQMDPKPKKSLPTFAVFPVNQQDPNTPSVSRTTVVQDPFENAPTVVEHVDPVLPESQIHATGSHEIQPVPGPPDPHDPPPTVLPEDHVARAQPSHSMLQINRPTDPARSSLPPNQVADISASPSTSASSFPPPTLSSNESVGLSPGKGTTHQEPIIGTQLASPASLPSSTGKDVENNTEEAEATAQTEPVPKDSHSAIVPTESTALTPPASVSTDWSAPSSFTTLPSSTSQSSTVSSSSSSSSASANPSTPSPSASFQADDLVPSSTSTFTAPPSSISESSTASSSSSSSASANPSTPSPSASFQPGDLAPSSTSTSSTFTAPPTSTSQSSTASSSSSSSASASSLTTIAEPSSAPTSTSATSLTPPAPACSTSSAFTTTPSSSSLSSTASSSASSSSVSSTLQTSSPSSSSSSPPVGQSPSSSTSSASVTPSSSTSSASVTPSSSTSSASATPSLSTSSASATPSSSTSSASVTPSSSTSSASATPSLSTSSASATPSLSTSSASATPSLSTSSASATPSSSTSSASATPSSSTSSQTSLQSVRLRPCRLSGGGLVPRYLDARGGGCGFGSSCFTVDLKERVVELRSRHGQLDRARGGAPREIRWADRLQMTNDDVTPAAPSTDNHQVLEEIRDTFRARHPQDTLELCMVCQERIASCVLLNCRDCVVCYTCASLVDECPMCGAEVLMYIKIY